MKIMKKISAVLLSICLCVPCFSQVVYAADGRISFTDPETAVGDMVEVKCALRSKKGNIGDVEVQLRYDSEYLRFQSGANVQEADGTLTYTGTGSSTELSFTVEFQALKEGETKISVENATVSSGSGGAMNLEHGNSTVKIAEGDPSKITEAPEVPETSSANDIQVEVNGVAYTLTDGFADGDIPGGYSRTTISLDGQERQMVGNQAGSITLGYLKNAEGTGDFFLYNGEDATFAPYEEIAISDTASIVVLSDTSKVKLPDTYQEAKLTLNEKDFPVWQDSTKEGYYVLYAMNNNGETGYYQYDTAENTYQRVDISADKDEDGKKDSKSLLGKFQKALEKHLSMIVLAGGLGGLLVLILLIVLGVKLHNRNVELDELYDEYGIDEDDDEEPVPVKTKDKPKKQGVFGRRGKAEDDFEAYDDDDFDEYDDDDDDYDYEEDDAEAKYDTVKFSGSEFETGAIGDLDDDVFSGFGQRGELTIDDLDDLMGNTSGKKRGHAEADDAFQVDFIDLD